MCFMALYFPWRHHSLTCTMIFLLTTKVCYKTSKGIFPRYKQRLWYKKSSADAVYDRRISAVKWITMYRYFEHTSIMTCSGKLSKSHHVCSFGSPVFILIFSGSSFRQNGRHCGTRRFWTTTYSHRISGYAFGLCASSWCWLRVFCN